MVIVDKWKHSPETSHSVIVLELQTVVVSMPRTHSDSKTQHTYFDDNVGKTEGGREGGRDGRERD